MLPPYSPITETKLLLTLQAVFPYSVPMWQNTQEWY